jgi:guanine deaminase
MCPGPFDNGQDIVQDRLVDPNLFGLLLKFKDFLAGENGRGVRIRIGRAAAQDFALVGRVRVADTEAHQEPVELRLRERIRTVVFKRILRGEHHERPAQRICPAVDGDLSLIHRLQQRRLGFRGGAVDLVGEEKIREDGAGLEFEFVGVGVEDADAGHVRRKHVGGELEAVEATVDGAREGVGKCRFADAGNIFNQQVATRQKAGQAKANDFGFPAERRLQAGGEGLQAGSHCYSGRCFALCHFSYDNNEMPESPDGLRWLRRAITLATENVTSGRGGPFGAVITKGGEVVAEGVNLVTVSCDPTAHAEVTAIRHAAAALGRFDLSGCEIHTSCEPCPMCLGAILWARLDRVWYAASHREAAAAGFDDSLFYEQMVLAPEERIIPMRRGLAEEANGPFTAWARFSAKVRY